jgi:hypothetical protein
MQVAPGPNWRPSQGSQATTTSTHLCCHGGHDAGSAAVVLGRANVYNDVPWPLPLSLAAYSSSRERLGGPVVSDQDGSPGRWLGEGPCGQLRLGRTVTTPSPRLGACGRALLTPKGQGVDRLPCAVPLPCVLGSHCDAYSSRLRSPSGYGDGSCQCDSCVIGTQGAQLSATCLNVNFKLNNAAGQYPSPGGSHVCPWLQGLNQCVPVELEGAGLPVTVPVPHHVVERKV